MNAAPVSARSVSPSCVKAILPLPFATLFEGRTKRKLGDFFGLTRYGVNLTELAPGAISALQHHHSCQDEFIYVVQGQVTLILGAQEYVLDPGDCVGFKAGAGVAHQLVNRSAALVGYLEIGDRTVGDEVSYPHDDLKAVQSAGGVWVFRHKNDVPY